MWGLPLFDIKDPAAVLFEINMVRRAKPNYYIKVACFDNSRGIESCVLSYIVQRPAYEPGFKLTRQEVAGLAVGCIALTWALVATVYYMFGGQEAASAPTSSRLAVQTAKPIDDQSREQAKPIESDAVTLGSKQVA